MDWDKAKNYTILFLFILNLLLLSFNISKSKQYILTEEQKNSIYSVLKNNDIELLSEIPDKFYPLQQLLVNKSDYDTIEIQKIFFNDIYNIKRTKEFDKTILTSENKTVTIQNSMITYIDKNISNHSGLDKQQAEKICEGLISKIIPNNKKVELDRYIENKDTFIFYYTQNFIDFPYFNNYIIFKIHKNGIFKLKFEYNEPLELYGNKIEICSADEALFTFMDEIKRIYDNPITIDKIDLGYFSSDINDTENSTFISIPHYRIFIAENDEPFYINAYNNTFVH